jgi:hypothetical protein
VALKEFMMAGTNFVSTNGTVKKEFGFRMRPQKCHIHESARKIIGQSEAGERLIWW